MSILSILVLSLLFFSCEREEIKEVIPVQKIERDSSPIKITYGTDPNQFGELRLPDEDGSVPVIMIIHGGCWLSAYDETLMDEMADDLTARGYATWNLEYRRLGNDGGGWPGTFLDVGKGLAKLREISTEYPIDLNRILVTGHSAGGHLALWLGAQDQLPNTSQIKTPGLPIIKGIVSLAGITDLSTYLTLNGCGSNVRALLGGSPDEITLRYSQGSPISFAPLGIPQVLVNGKNDNIVPVSHIQPYYDASVAASEKIELVTIPEAGHFEVIAPGSVAWPAIVEAFEKVLTW